MVSAAATFPNLAYPVKRLSVKRHVDSESLDHTGKFSDIRKVGINGYASISARSGVHTTKHSLRKDQLQKLYKRSFRK